MRKIFGEYAYPIIVIVGFCCITIISWLFSKVNLDNPINFWQSVLPSAFVDVISLVISTILITKIINRKKIHNENLRLYKLINKPHDRLMDVILYQYKDVIGNQNGEYFEKDIELDGFEETNIAPYFKKYVHKDFQKDELIFSQNTQHEDENGAVSFGIKKVPLLRVKVMDMYQEKVNETITEYIREFGPILNTDYLSLIIDVREKIKENPLDVHNFMCDSEKIPIILDVNKFIKNNQKYINSVLKVKNYFNDIDIKSINDKNVDAEWGVIGIGVTAIFVTYLFIKIGELLISL